MLRRRKKKTLLSESMDLTRQQRAMKHSSADRLRRTLQSRSTRIFAWCFAVAALLLLIAIVAFFLCAPR